MKNKWILILIALIALILSAYFINKESAPAEGSILVKEIDIYEYDK